MIQRPLLQKNILYTKHARYDDHDSKKVTSLTIETNVQRTQKFQQQKTKNKTKTTKVTHDKFRDTWTLARFLQFPKILYFFPDSLKF